MSELDRYSELHQNGTLSTLSEFYEWLRSQGLHLARWGELTEDRPCLICRETGKVERDNDDPLAGWSASVLERITEDCTYCEGRGFEVVVTGEDWIIDHRSPDRLFADFLGIDLNKLEQERREALDRVREMNGGR